MEDFKYLTELPGTPQEQAWLTEHLETLSVREGYALSASIMQRSPESMADAINCLHTLDDYDVCFHAGTYEQLGRFYLDRIAKALDTVRRMNAGRLSRRNWKPRCWHRQDLRQSQTLLNTPYLQQTSGMRSGTCMIQPVRRHLRPE